MDKYIQSEIKEAAIIRRFLNGDDISDSPLWHAPGIPTFYHAVFNLAPYFGIISIAESVTPIATVNGQLAYVSTVTCQRDNLSRIGAATSSDKDIAKFLAYRNAIRQLIPQQGVKLVWQDKHHNAKRYI